MTSATPANRSSSYEQDRAELEDVVHKLEMGGVPLEESLALWERGEALAKQCQDWLDGARRRLDSAQGAAQEPVQEPAEGISPAAAEDSSRP
jgi:exodeoxyribonuclease VII small subunit